MSFTCPTCGTVKGCLSGYSLQISPQHQNAIDAANATEQRNRELTRQVEQLQARVDAAEKLVEKWRAFASDPSADGDAAGYFEQTADELASAITAPPSSSDPGRADTGREET